MASRYVVEHLNHLGIVAEVCREIGVAAWLDQQEPGKRQQVSVGTATVALVLNGLGFSNRQLYLVPQFFADKPVEHLLGLGITAEDLNDDCLGRTLDWLYEQDVTRLFAGLALRARRVFGVSVERLHADTTSFSVHGQYAPAPTPAPRSAAEAGTAASALVGTAGEAEPAVIEVTYGYSRDHREDLKQWMVALVTSGEGVPQFLQPLDGNVSDKRSLLEAVTALTQQLQESGETPGVYAADSGLYSTENMTTLNGAGVRWVSRVPETSIAAQAMVRETPAAWQTSTDRARQWWSRLLTLPQGSERWIVVRSQDGEARARATLQRQADAAVALAKACQRPPAWLQVQSDVVAMPKYAQPGRPRKDALPPIQVWQIQASVTLDPVAVEREALRRAAFLLGTNLVDAVAWPDEAVIALYREQTVAERGFAFLKDPLFLASSVFVKKPERIVALSLVLVLCLLVYRLAEHRLRQQLAATGQTVPTQLKQPTDHPTLRWIFQCFEGVSLVRFTAAHGPPLHAITGLEPLHEQVIRLLGPSYEKLYELGA